MKILKGDKVSIIVGKDKGRSGEVIRAIPKSLKVVVKGLNLFKKHIKPAQGRPGAIVEKERPLLVSKVMFICPSCQKPARVGYQINDSKQKSRICRRCKAIITRPVSK
ncbi:MAG: 50S ribosomal protein L24 [Candidatus Shapirobacteria bacterium]|jgi:large subunit ribosomal protein L24